MRHWSYKRNQSLGCRNKQIVFSEHSFDANGEVNNDSHVNTSFVFITQRRCVLREKLPCGIASLETQAKVECQCWTSYAIRGSFIPASTCQTIRQAAAQCVYHPAAHIKMRLWANHTDEGNSGKALPPCIVGTFFFWKKKKRNKERTTDQHNKSTKPLSYQWGVVEYCVGADWREKFVTFLQPILPQEKEAGGKWSESVMCNNLQEK